MDTLPASLTSHQRGPARTPALTLTLLDQTHGRPRFHWQQWHDATPGTGPTAATLTPDGSHVLAHNTSGFLLAYRTTNPGPSATWTSSAFLAFDATAGAGVAIASTDDDVVLVYADSSGERLRAYTSTDDGASWSGPATILSEATPIAHLALAADPTGDLVLFYSMDGTTDVKHVRRTSGSWGGSGTTWSRSGDLDTLSGIAAVHDGSDVQLAVTGTTDTDQEPILAAAIFGEGGFPAGVWGTLTAIQQLDADSSSSFTHPAIAITGGTAYVAFRWEETGDAPSTRAYFTHPADGAVNTGSFLEPYPVPLEPTHTPTLTANADLADLAIPGQVFGAQFPDARDLSATVTAADWKHTPTSTTATFTLDDATGALASGLAPAPGMDLALAAGYASGTGGSAESGATRRFRIQRVQRHISGRRRTLTITATGPWESLEHWRSPIAHHIAAGTDDRLDLAVFFAGRAGVPITGSPSGWTTEPGFALNPGESAATALSRLLTPTTAAVRHEDGTLTLLDPPTTSEETYSATEHPIIEAHTIEEAPHTNWLRIQGAERYADAHHFASLNAHGPRFRVQRHLFATTNQLAEDTAEAALERETRLAPRLSLTVPHHAGQRLFDVVSVQIPELDIDDDYRVTALQHHYRRQQPTPTFTTTLTLSEP